MATRRRDFKCRQTVRSIVNATVRDLLRTAYQIDLSTVRFTLVVGSSNPLIRESCSLMDSSEQGIGIRGVRSAGAISRLIGRIQSFVDRPIIDATGLVGMFEWTLSVNLTATPDDVEATPIFAALQEQLGLKLEPRTGPYDVLVIDLAEMPSEN